MDDNFSTDELLTIRRNSQVDDLGQMGVGGDDSWGKRTLQKYSLNEQSYRYGFTLVPYKQ